MPRARHGSPRVVRGIQEVRLNDEVLSDKQRNRYYPLGVIDTTDGSWLGSYILVSLERQVETARSSGMTVEQIQNGRQAS